MLFRLGRAREPSVVSGRRPLDNYLEGDILLSRQLDLISIEPYSRA